MKSNSSFYVRKNSRSAESRMLAIYEKSKDGLYLEDKVVAIISDYCLQHEIGPLRVCQDIGLSQNALINFLVRYEKDQVRNMSLKMAVVMCEFAGKKLVIQDAT